MPIYAIITAAGQSRRMGLSLPKPLLPLYSRPVLDYSLSLFASLGIERLIVTAPEDKIALFAPLMAPYPQAELIAGGATRAESIYNALSRLSGTGLVLVHDGARPLITSDLVLRVKEKAQAFGAAIPVLPLKDTVKEVDDGGAVTATLRRSKLRLVQTPEAFSLPLIKEAYEKEKHLLSDAEALTDDSSLLEKLGHKVLTVMGDEHNIKITTPGDLELAEFYLQKA